MPTTKSVRCAALLLATAKPFRPKDADLEALAGQVGQALERARLYQSEQQARRSASSPPFQMARLHASRSALTRALTPLEVADVIVREGVAALRGKGRVAGAAVRRRRFPSLHIDQRRPAKRLATGAGCPSASGRSPRLETKQPCTSILPTASPNPIRRWPARHDRRRLAWCPGTGGACVRRLCHRNAAVDADVNAEKDLLAFANQGAGPGPRATLRG
jgi:hypothetical protein